MFKQNEIPYCILINKIDITIPNDSFIDSLPTDKTISISTKNFQNCEKEVSLFLSSFTSIIKNKVQINNEFNMFSGLVDKKEVCIFVTPIDSGTPKGRMILPQVQALRNLLDKNAIVLFTQLQEYVEVIKLLDNKVKLVVTDSQVIKEVIELSNNNQMITTFSILLSRLKGDFGYETISVKNIDSVGKYDRVLIAEGCSHHSQKEDIARVKLPKLLEKYLGYLPELDYCSGRDFPSDISKYKIIIHCGACMQTQKEKISRINLSKQQSIPFTNFGMAIAYMNKYFERVIQPFDKLS